MARGLVLILLSCPLFAQFSHFAATDDGRQMYFTSTLQLAGDPPGVAGSRIFRVTGNLLASFAGRPGRYQGLAPAYAERGRALGCAQSANRTVQSAELRILRRPGESDFRADQPDEVPGL